MALQINKQNTWKVELLSIIALSICLYIVASHYDFLEIIVEFSREHENLEIDEFITVGIFLVFSLSFFSFRRLNEALITKTIITHKNIELEKALDEIKELKGILPICSSCKSIRNDGGFWEKVETYIQRNTNALFTHSMCPDCMKKFYPDFVNGQGDSGPDQ